MNKEEAQKLLLKGISVGIFLAFADTAADMDIKLGATDALLSAAKEDGESEESLNSLRSQIEVYDKLCDSYTDAKCNSVTKYFSDLTIDECNFVYSMIKELCLSNEDKVQDEFDYVITEVLLNNK